LANSEAELKMLNSNRDQPQYWRERAEDALTDAASASDLRVKAKLLGVARAYDVIAQRAGKKIKLVPRAFQGARYAGVVAGRRSISEADRVLA
jgi:hypothetical protein